MISCENYVLHSIFILADMSNMFPNCNSAESLNGNSSYFHRTLICCNYRLYTDILSKYICR